MSEFWFYINMDEKIGPVTKNEIENLFSKGNLTGDSFVWSQGMEDWEKLEEIKTFSQLFVEEKNEREKNLPQEEITWDQINGKDQIFAIKIGPDRGAEEKILDGWYSLEQLIDFVKENRMNEKTLVWSNGMKEWKALGEIPLKEKIFQDKQTETIKKEERRKFQRFPVLARVFFESDKRFHIGICKDISEGGIKVLVNNFQGKVGDAISMNVHKENSDLSFVAKGIIVALSPEKGGFSLKFNEISPETRSTILLIQKN
jgi:hypothetical protein